MDPLAKKAFGAALKSIRLSKKMNQKECAAKIGISVAQLSSYEHGKKSFDIGITKQVAAAHDMHPFEFIQEYYKYRIQTETLLET